MIKYVTTTNIDDRVIDEACQLLINGSVVAIPTDTNWSIICDIQSKSGIEILKKLKQNATGYMFTVMCSQISQINEIAELNNSNFKFIKQLTPGPYVFILPSRHETKKIINMKRKEIGIRIPFQHVPNAIIEKLGRPVFAITASKEMGNIEWWDEVYAEENMYEFGFELEEIEDVALIIDSDTGEPQPKVLSTVISLLEEEPVIIRDGVGKV